MTTSKAPKTLADKPSLPPPPVSPRSWRWLSWTGGGLGAVLLAGVVITGGAYAQQEKTIVKNTTILSQPVGGLDSLTALETVTAAWSKAKETGLRFSLKGEEYTVPLEGSGNDETIILDVVSFQPSAAVDQAFAFGHDGPAWGRAWQRLSGWLGRRHEFGRLAINEGDVVALLQQELSGFEQPPVNASLDYDGQKTFTVTPSKPGSAIGYSRALKTAKRQLRQLQLSPIALTIAARAPEIPTSPALTTLADTTAANLLEQAPITLQAGEKKWTIDAKQLGQMLGFVLIDKKVQVGIDQVKGAAYIDSIKKDIEVVPKDAKFSIVDGKVKEFQTSQVGKTVDVAATFDHLNTAVTVASKTPVELVVVEQKPMSDTIGANNLGVTELVAEGKTSFRGSPTNRRYNLSYGSEILNGLLIKPGEEFSLVTALGKIDGAHGWKPELVIKEGGRITPEFGGGLCQVATTLFRAVLYAGLPIIERRNHSLRISYYEPPIGLDATIYEPKPDLRFTNDYNGYLLLQTEVVGDDLIFRFYGAKDGRVIDIPEPKVYNKTGIPATKTIEVTDLPPGEKVCQSPGHPGADATATYTVTKADGTSATQVFQSHYKAVGVICRVGKPAKKKTSIAPVTAASLARASQ